MKIRFLIFILFPLLLCSCAQIVPLSGGEKDVLPPQEVSSLPVNGAVNFTEETIVITFNEYIRLQNLSSQLIISPLMDEAPDITVRGKKVVIKMQGELLPNTTYSINFGSAISDITEGNTIPNFKYVFSTGSHLDSLSYTGYVADAFTLAEKEKVYVLLYDQLNDSIPMNGLPRYISITDKKGNYSITNIAEGKYKLFALADINSNYMYDLPNEEIAFKQELVRIDSSSNNNILYLFNEENDIQYLVKAANETYGKIDFEFNLPTKKLIITPNVQLKKQWFLEEKNEAGDSITHWLKDVDELKEITYVFYDGGEVIDTSEVSIIPREDLKDTTLILSDNITPNFDLNRNIQLTAVRPVTNFYKDSIVLLEDSVAVPFKFSNTDKVFRKFQIEYDFIEDKNYVLKIPPATLTDHYGLKNDTIVKKFRTKKEADYGNIYLTMTPDFPESYIVELYSGKKMVSRKFHQGTQVINYKYLSPGDYFLKLIVDNNNNQKWDTGDYLNHVQPEKVVLYKKEIKIRANWDNEITWKVKL